MIQYTFVDTGTEIYRILVETPDGAFVISHNEPNKILFMSNEALANATRIKPPALFEKNTKRVQKPTKAVAERMEVIRPLLEDEVYITSKKKETKWHPNSKSSMASQNGLYYPCFINTLD